MPRALPGVDLFKAFAVIVDGHGAGEAGLSSISEIDGAFVSRFVDHPPAWLETEISDVSGHVADGALALNTALSGMPSVANKRARVSGLLL